jgi:hypothetical protein
MDPSLRTGVLDIPGVTSAEIYKQSTFSRPIEGQSSRELHHEHEGAGKHRHAAA